MHDDGEHAFLSLYIVVWFFIVLLKLMSRVNVFFLFFFSLRGFECWAVRPNSWSVFLFTHSFPFFLSFLFYAPMKQPFIFFWHLDFPPEKYNNKWKAHIRYDYCISLAWINCKSTPAVLLGRMLIKVARKRKRYKENNPVSLEKYQADIEIHVTRCL